MITASFLELKKQLKRMPDSLATVRAALLGDSATQWLATAVKGMAVKYQLNLDLFEADYNQIEQQAFDPTSGLYEHQPEFIIICKSTEALEQKFLTLKGSSKIDFSTFV